MGITAAMVKELRDKTGVGMMDCKKALQESAGNIDAAIKSLREKGLSKAAKKSDRSAKEGRVVTCVNGNRSIIFELNCETDFVAKNENFVKLGKVIAAAIVDKSISSVEDIKVSKVQDVTVDSLISDSILQLGENIVIGKYKQLETGGSFSSYEHGNGKIGVVVDFSGDIDEQIGHDIAMQVAAMNPAYVSSSQVPSGDLENEKAILRKQALADGKPEQVVDKIVNGRMSKFYTENCLIEQAFVKDNDKKIKDLLSGDITINLFERFSLE